MVNKVELLGRLGANPETQILKNGTHLTKISVGTNEVWKDKVSGEKREETSWHNITFFAKTAENAARILQKGSLVYVEGKIKYNTVKKDDGSSIRYTDIQARDFRILADGKRNENTQSQDTGNQGTGNQGTQNTSIPSVPVGAGAGNQEDDDLPF